MIESPDYDDIIPFEKKCLYVGLPMSSEISKDDKQIIIRNIHLCLSPLHVICRENLYNNIINNSSKPYSSSTRITKLNSEKMLYMVEYLKLLYYVRM